MADAVHGCSSHGASPFVRGHPLRLGQSCTRSWGNVPVTVSSGFSRIRHNADVDGASDSMHLYGSAGDPGVPGVPGESNRTVYRKAETCGFSDLETYTRDHQHVERVPIGDDALTFGRMGAMTEIRTPRLLLRRWHDDDLAPMAEFNEDPQVMQWVDDGSVRNLDDTAQAIERWEEEWDEEGFGLFAVELLASGELAGFTGLSVPEFLPEVLPAVAISCRLGSQFWGQGYASEAAQATLEFALQDRALDRVISINQVGNDAFENVVRKLGMVRERETTHPVYGYRLRVHAIDLTEFQA
jgi:RimJ/RimL family protein N-acetyltransferase